MSDDAAPPLLPIRAADGPAKPSSSAGIRTLLDLFRQFADIRSEYVVYYDGYRSWSYRYDEIAGASRAFAERLRRESIGKGDKVLIWSESRPEWIAAFWGCLLNGSIVVPIDYRSSADVMCNTQQVVRARLVLIGDDVHPPANGLDISCWRLCEVDLHAASPAPVEDISPDDTAELVFTSGSTAVPKGVVITHRNLAADLEPIQREVMKYRGYVRPLFPLRFLNLLPLSHMFGQLLAMFFPPMLPGAVVLMRGYSPQEVVRQIRRRRVSFLICVPKMLEVMRQYVVRRFPETAAPPSADSRWPVRWWRYRRVHRMFGLKFWGVVVGGAPLEPALEEFWSRLGFLVVQGYGLTETAPVISFSHPFHGHPFGSAGQPLPGVEVKIAADGEILVRGDMITPGYFNAPSESMKAFENGWLHTGDIGKLDAGHLFVRGRKKEMIVTPAGLKIFPEDVELVINALAGVRDCAVVGKDRVHAVLVLEPGANKEQVVGLANARLEAHQRIRAASVWTAGDLPRVEGTGKLKRSAIQKWVEAGAPAGAAKPADKLDELIARFAPDRAITLETTLDQLGLSSLERVELLVELEQQFNATIDEAVFTGEYKVADLAKMLHAPAALREESFEANTWNCSVAARVIRRAGLAGFAIPMTRLLIKLTVTGLKHLESIDAPVIFAANHQSYLDVPAIYTALPGRWRYRVAPAMLKEFFEAHFHPERYSRWRRFVASTSYFVAALFFNGFPLSQQEADTRQTLRHIGELVSDNWSIMIFPEGGLSVTGEIEAFQPGAAMLAARLRLPVIPVRLRGLDRILPRGASMIQPGAASIAFGAPLHLQGDDYTALARRIEEAVRVL